LNFFVAVLFGNLLWLRTGADFFIGALVLLVYHSLAVGAVNGVGLPEFFLCGLDFALTLFFADDV